MKQLTTAKSGANMLRTLFSYKNKAITIGEILGRRLLRLLDLNLQSSPAYSDQEHGPPSPMILASNNAFESATEVVFVGLVA